MVSWSLIMAESNAVNRFRIPKRGEEQGKLLKESVPKWSVIFLFAFHATHKSRYSVETYIQITDDLDVFLLDIWIHACDEIQIYIFIKYLDLWMWQNTFHSLANNLRIINEFEEEYITCT